MTSTLSSFSLLAARWLCALLLVLAPSVLGQTQLHWGDRVDGLIRQALQRDVFLLAGAQQNDTLRITFSSQNSGYPSYYYYHQLEVLDGTTPVGTPIVGLGTLTIQLPRTVPFYTIVVRARNGQSTGWYSFKLDRLNAPVSAHRIAFNWILKGATPAGIGSRADFATYTLHATAGGVASLNFTCEDSGYPNYYFYHYAELLDSTGTPVARVDGNGSSAPFTVQTDQDYTLFVAARNWESTGWFRASVQCLSWPGTPCDCTPWAFNYGDGCGGTNGVPSLTGSTPRLATTGTINVGNSSGAPTTGVLLIGTDVDNFLLSGCTLHVANPSLIVLPLPAGGLVVPYSIPNSTLLCGFGLTVQSVVADPAAPGQLAFSRGLGLIFG